MDKLQEFIKSTEFIFILLITLAIASPILYLHFEPAEQPPTTQARIKNHSFQHGEITIEIQEPLESENPGTYQLESPQLNRTQKINVPPGEKKEATLRKENKTNIKEETEKIQIHITPIHDQQEANKTYTLQAVKGENQ